MSVLVNSGRMFLVLVLFFHFLIDFVSVLIGIFFKRFMAHIKNKLQIEKSFYNK